MRMSHAKRRLLANALKGQILYGHCRTVSDYGGLHGTLGWATRNDLVFLDQKTRTWLLTEKGRQLAAKEFGLDKTTAVKV